MAGRNPGINVLRIDARGASGTRGDICLRNVLAPFFCSKLNTVLTAVVFDKEIAPRVHVAIRIVMRHIPNPCGDLYTAQARVRLGSKKREVVNFYAIGGYRQGHAARDFNEATDRRSGQDRRNPSQSGPSRS